jgi:hypothetical protein
MAKRWYAYIGPPGSELTINKYRLAQDGPFGCNTGFTLCAIYAEYGGEHPVRLSRNILDYIAVALMNGVNQPALTGPPYYVYTKKIST